MVAFETTRRPSALRRRCFFSSALSEAKAWPCLPRPPLSGAPVADPPFPGGVREGFREADLVFDPSFIRRSTSVFLIQRTSINLSPFISSTGDGLQRTPEGPARDCVRADLEGSARDGGLARCRATHPGTVSPAPASFLRETERFLPILFSCSVRSTGYAESLVNPNLVSRDRSSPAPTSNPPGIDGGSVRVRLAPGARCAPSNLARESPSQEDPLHSLGFRRRA